jgi:hypothetical protein
MKRVGVELLGLVTGIVGVLYLTGWDETLPLYGVLVVAALMLLRWIDAWCSGRRRATGSPSRKDLRKG